MEKSISKADKLKRVVRIISKILISILLIVIAIVTVSSVSPIYNFREAHQFEGEDIFNPYKNFDSTSCWKRANFHTHTRVEGILNECNYWPDEVLKAYEQFGYDIVTFSNHNELTINPKGAEYQANAYEHGYNLFKFQVMMQKVALFSH